MDMGAEFEMLEERTSSRTIGIAWTIVHAGLRLICLLTWRRRRESSLYDFVRVVPKLGARAGLFAQTLHTGVIGDCNRQCQFFMHDCGR